MSLPGGEKALLTLILCPSYTGEEKASLSPMLTVVPSLPLMGLTSVIFSFLNHHQGWGNVKSLLAQFDQAYLWSKV